VHFTGIQPDCHGPQLVAVILKMLGLPSFSMQVSETTDLFRRHMEISWLLRDALHVHEAVTATVLAYLKSPNPPMLAYTIMHNQEVFNITDRKQQGQQDAERNTSRTIHQVCEITMAHALGTQSLLLDTRAIANSSIFTVAISGYHSFKIVF
jgi:hypothetical protein